MRRPIYNPNKPLFLLEERHIMDMILFIWEKGICKKTDVYFSISQSSRLVTKLERMEDAGIVIQIHHKAGRYTDVKLTPYGERIAVVLKDLKEAMMTVPPEVYHQEPEIPIEQDED